MKLLRILPLALCYLAFCGCSDSESQAQEQEHQHEHDHEHEHGHEHDGDKHEHQHGTEQKDAANKPTKKTGKLNIKRFDHFGDGVTEGKTVSLSELASNPAAYADQHVRVKGEVTAVCKTMGCWLVVSDGQTHIRAFTRGHAYFVPKDCEGRTAVLEGIFSLTEESVAFQRHLLEDAGKPAEAEMVTEPNKNALKLDAEGVALAKLESKK